MIEWKFAEETNYKVPVVWLLWQSS